MSVTAAETKQLFINNQWVEPDSGLHFDALDPFTGEPWARIPQGNARDVDRACSAAEAAFHGPWSRLSATERGMLLVRLAQLIELSRYRAESPHYLLRPATRSGRQHARDDRLLVHVESTTSFDQYVHRPPPKADRNAA